MKQLWKDEMVNTKTRCWAQGMDGWRSLHLIPQLKWSLLATGQAVLNETDLATLILNMLIRMCEYYPSRWECAALSTVGDRKCAFMTFEPGLISHVALTMVLSKALIHYSIN